MANLSKRLRFAFVLPLLLAAGCQVSDLTPKAEKPLPPKIVAKMKAKGMSKSSPIMIRIFKEEGQLEVWKQKDTGRYDLVTAYDICKWSGRLGPKFMENDRQAPEGFYTVRPAQMNPKSSYHLSFNIGFPNAYDRVHGRSGAHLMVHGACSSAGCYSMSDEQVEEIFAFARDSFKGGQTEFQIQAFPFRMTAQNMARYQGDPNFAFWENLKEGYDQFETAKVPPKVDVCDKRYVFNMQVPEGTRLSATDTCPQQSQPVAYGAQKAKQADAFTKVSVKASSTPRAPSIKGPHEAAVIAAWQKKRVQGQPVGNTPPYLPDTAIAAAPPAAPAAATAVTAAASIEPEAKAAPIAVAAAPTPGINTAAAPASDALTRPTTVAFPPVPEAPEATSAEAKPAASANKPEQTEEEAFAEAAATAQAQADATVPAKKKRWWQVLSD
jgi:murein L,D-transpeptidase YafK